MSFLKHSHTQIKSKTISHSWKLASKNSSTIQSYLNLNSAFLTFFLNLMIIWFYLRMPLKFFQSQKNKNFQSGNKLNAGPSFVGPFINSSFNKLNKQKEEKKVKFFSLTNLSSFSLISSFTISKTFKHTHSLRHSLLLNQFWSN